MESSTDTLVQCPQENPTFDKTESMVSYKMSSSCESHSRKATGCPLDTNDQHKNRENEPLTTFSQRNGGNSCDIESSQKNRLYVHVGTSTEKTGIQSDGKKCKYCLIRLAKLRQLERKKPEKISSRISFSSSQKQASGHNLQIDKACQTSAALYEQAPMTQREIRCFMLVLRYRNGKPLRTETYCSCVMHGREDDCTCGEEDEHFEWLWDSKNKGDAAHVLDNGRIVVFHKDYSCGTAAICGQQLMDRHQHFWEIKMTTPVYGTDMMIGVGTPAVDLNGHHNEFSSMLGIDGDSWGFSYDGRLQHNNRKTDYCGRYGQGAIIGVHLDMWHGTLAFFKNRRSLGVAYKGLRGKSLYPMACSTAARSAMKVISSCSFASSLQFLCCRQLRKLVPPHLSVLDVLQMPPGLRLFLSNNLGWLLQVPPVPNARLSSQSSATSISTSNDHICNICLPLKNVFEGYTDDEGESSDGDHVHNGFNFMDSEEEEDSEESDAEEIFRSSLQTKQHAVMVRLRGPAAASVPNPFLHGTSSHTPPNPKRQRLDLTLNVPTEEEDRNTCSEPEDSILEKGGDAPFSDRRESSEGASRSQRKHKLGKRKRTQR
ncbi:hypothetical protein EGW08_019815 [Elysia chlorotica]|uniref:SPRY domain-containing SOCS box protein 3 n=1 Tax=Elysia chlorotica TaxID=188477 RepID=A0A3S0Z9C5_ELYCH|nr:hypothetical protein EGW08_019815 [Elysia chlorotica]